MNVLKTLPMIVMGVLFVAGCGSESDKASGEVDHATVYAIGSTNSYMLSSGISQLANDMDEPIDYTISETNGDIEGIRMVMQDRGEFVDISGTNGVFAHDGTYVFEEEQYEEIRGVVALEAPITQFIVRADSNIDTLSDLEGASIATFQNTAQLSVENTLNQAGLQEGEDYSLETLPAQEQSDALRDNNIDAFVTYSAYPSSVVQSLDETTSVKVLPVGEDVIYGAGEEFNQEANPVKLEADSAKAYSGQSEDVTTAQTGRYFVTREDVDEDLVYEFTKFVHEQAEELSNYHPTAEEITIENSIETIDIPLHPGAERYYREEGYIE
ncbi:TAXI family TRAP transporter solute-binding subunit [Salicibibacter cibarius]|uniref:TAXI family TRAP transporter solute-binding subunit n=1 Tax=Salicibibacter cibarius TaxID=2743000 RepID=A0A7T6Z4B0_9BACI|nr:TAXI family TRAP transporter solute-binding subunit [Salicibibacter cibarius]QQK76581.1 TAXI family TRAP transporter solute-binding subunit [Salicibibacter cibarius]